MNSNNSFNTIEDRLYHRPCKHCGTLIDKRNKFCPACSHTLEAVTTKNDISDNKSGVAYLILYITMTSMIIFLGFLSFVGLSVMIYFLGKTGFCLGVGIITFIWTYMLFNVIKPVVVEVKHANNYIESIRFK